MKEKIYFLILFFWLQTMHGAQAPLADGVTKIRVAEAEFFYLEDFPRDALEDPHDAYKLVFLLGEQLQEIGRVTLRAISGTKISMPEEVLEESISFLEQVQTKFIAKKFARERENQSFGDFLGESIFDLEILSEAVDVFYDIIDSEGGDISQIAEHLIEYKETILFVASYLAEILPRQWPELTMYSARVPPVVKKQKKKSTDRKVIWQLVGDLHQVITGLTKAMRDQVENIGKALVGAVGEKTSSKEHVLELESQESVIASMVNLSIDNGSVMVQPLLEPENFVEVEDESSQQSCFGFLWSFKRIKNKFQQLISRARFRTKGYGAGSLNLKLKYHDGFADPACWKLMHCLTPKDLNVRESKNKKCKADVKRKGKRVRLPA